MLVDDFDQPNGYAVHLPYAMMGLFVALPEPGSPFDADGLESWLELLIRHEYAHIVHLDKAAGRPLALRRVFGRHLFSFPHLLQPLWLIEGLAMHFETDAARNAGRGQSAHTDMVLRTEVAAGVRPLRQVNVPNRSWPAGEVQYAYGVAFYQFLSERHGAERVSRFLDHYASNAIPFRLNTSAEHAFGRNFDVLWHEFDEWLFQLFGPQLQRLREQGLREGERLTDPGTVGLHDGGNLHAGRDGSVYYVADSGEHRPRLVRRHADGRIERLAKVNRGARISVHQDGRVMIAQPEVCREYRRYYDLYLLEPGMRAPRRLTECSRFRDVAWRPGSDELVALRHARGRSELVLVDAAGEAIRTLVESQPGDLYAQPDWSPDGTRIVLVRLRSGTGGDLFEYTPADGGWLRLTADPNIPLHPRYSLDGAHVLFTSDHGGMHDLRRVARADGGTVTLTRTETGAFQPVEGPDGIHYLLYGADGYELRRLPSGGPVDPLPAPRPAPERRPAQAPVPDHASEAYTPWPTLRPTSWAPHLLLDGTIEEYGVVLWGRDAVGVHSWFALPVYERTGGDFGGTASYVWSDRVFTGVTRRNVATDGGIVRDDTAMAALRMPVSRVDQVWNWFVGGALDHERHPGGRTFRDNVAGGALVFDSARSYRLSVSPQEGRQVRVVAEDSVGGSDYSGSVVTLDWREFVHLGHARVLALRYAYGSGGEHTRPFVLGGTRSEALLLVAGDHHGIFNQRRYSLRGYQVGDPALVGRDMQLVAAEYRFPIRLVEYGLMRPPVGIERWSGSVFVEAGGARDGGGTMRAHPAAGIETVVDLNIGYRFGGLRLRAGFAHGLDRDVGGENQVYLEFGLGF